MLQQVNALTLSRALGGPNQYCQCQASVLVCSASDQCRSFVYHTEMTRVSATAYSPLFPTRESMQRFLYPASQDLLATTRSLFKHFLMQRMVILHELALLSTNSFLPQKRIKGIPNKSTLVAKIYSALTKMNHRQKIIKLYLVLFHMLFRLYSTLLFNQFILINKLEPQISLTNQN